MWDIPEPSPVKLIVGLLAADRDGLDRAVARLAETLGPLDSTSETWPFTQTRYYEAEMGPEPLRRFVSVERLVDPGDLAAIKHRTNALEQELARDLGPPLPRPVNLDPGLIEPSKLVLASTKNFAHRVYIGRGLYAEVTLSYRRGRWTPHAHTFPDYREPTYHGFLSRVRARLQEQRRAQEAQPA